MSQLKSIKKMKNLSNEKVIILYFFVVFAMCFFAYVYNLRENHDSLQKRFDFLYVVLQKEQAENKEIKERKLEIKRQMEIYHKNKEVK